MSHEPYRFERERLSDKDVFAWLQVALSANLDDVDRLEAGLGGGSRPHLNTVATQPCGAGESGP